MKVWGWAGFLVFIGIICVVAWITFYDNDAAAIYALVLAVIVAIFVWIVNVGVASLCFLLTGRVPG